MLQIVPICVQLWLKLAIGTGKLKIFRPCGTHLWEGIIKVEADSSLPAIEAMVRELINLRRQAQASHDRVAELSESLIPQLVLERKFVAVLSLQDELMQLGVAAENVRPIREQATKAIQSARELAENGHRLLAAKQPRKAIKEYAKAVQICSDYSPGFEGSDQAARVVFRQNATAVAALLLLIILIGKFGIPALLDWKAGRAWDRAQQGIKIAGDNEQRIEQCYQDYLSAFPAGNKASTAELALTEMRQARQAFNQSVTNEATGNYTEALTDYTNAVALNPKLANPKWSQKLADQEGARQARIEQAKQAFGHGVTNQAAGDLASALADYNLSIELNPKEAIAYRNRGVVKRAAGDLTGTMADMDKSIELAPNDVDAYGYRGLLREASGNLHGALMDYTRAIELNPSQAKAYKHRGTVKAAKGDHPGAMADFNQSLVLDPGDADAYRKRGNLKQSENDLAGAIADYTKTIEINPNDAAVFYGRGASKLLKGDPDGALSDLNMAIEIAPNYVSAYYPRSHLKRDKGDLAGAVADYNRFVELDQTQADPKWHQQLIWESGKPERLELSKRSNNTGITNQLNGDLAGAMAAYNKAIELDPNNMDAYGNRGVLREIIGDLVGTLADFTKAIELAPMDVNAYGNRGVLMETTGDLAGATADYNKAIELNPKLANQVWLQKTAEIKKRLHKPGA